MSDRPTARIEREQAQTILSADAEQGGAPMSVAAGHLVAGRYRLEKVLGFGGMGEVYKAEHVALGIPVAVKIMHRRLSSNPELTRRFQREARATSQLHHPNIVRVMDFGEDAGLHFIVMEYLEGESCEKWLARLDVPPPLSEVASVLSPILDALGAAHAAGIVHRDLKPENVFLRRNSDGTRSVTVVDFGLAHFDDERDRGGTLTKADMVAGTPQYMSPEQCHSLSVGPSSDLYAIGCILTELLQLRPPFRGAAAMEVITQQLFIPPPPLARPGDAEPVPPLLEQLRLDLLAKTPEGRPSDAAEAKRRLEEAMSPEASERRLPARKGDVPLGEREGRLPEWTFPPAPRQDAPTPGAAAFDVLLVRLTDGPGGVTSACITGVAAQGMILREGLAESTRAVVLDAGDDLDGARDFLQQARAEARDEKTIVCLAGVTAERMNALIAAGAADFVPYPVSPDALGRKIKRVLRRGR